MFFFFCWLLKNWYKNALNNTMSICHFNENVSISTPFQYAKLLSFLFHCQKILCYPEVTELIILCFKNNKDLSVVHRLILSTCILLEELWIRTIIIKWTIRTLIICNWMVSFKYNLSSIAFAFIDVSKNKTFSNALIRFDKWAIKFNKYCVCAIC